MHASRIDHAPSAANGACTVRARWRIGHDTYAVYLDAVDWGLATAGLALLLVAAVSQRLSNSPVTPAMVVVTIVYALLSLTILRMLPVAISLWGTHARRPTVAFIGWFGPRGLASIVFAVIVEDTYPADAGTILTACYLTVTRPGSRRIAARLSREATPAGPSTIRLAGAR